MTMLTEGFKEPTASSKFKSEGVLHLRLESFVELDLQKDNQTF